MKFSLINRLNGGCWSWKKCRTMIWSNTGRWWWGGGRERKRKDQPAEKESQKAKVGLKPKE